MYKRRILSFVLSGLLSGIACISSNGTNIYGQQREIVQPDSDVMTIVGAVTLFRAGLALGEMYQIPITFEGPTDVLQWDDDVDQETVAGGRIDRIPKRVTFVIPDDVTPDKNEKFDSRIFERVVETYQKQFGGPKYKLTNSKLGLHLITDQVRNKDGKWEKVEPYLDAIISIPSEKRTALGHLEKIVEAVNATKELKLWINFPFEYNLLWASNDIRSLSRPRSQYTDEYVQMMNEKLPFEWGKDKGIARDALIDLVEKSNTTLTWQVDCTDHPNVDLKCLIQLMPLNVNYLGPDGKKIRTALFYDRENADKRDIK